MGLKPLILVDDQSLKYTSTNLDHFLHNLNAFKSHTKKSYLPNGKTYKKN